MSHVTDRAVSVTVSYTLTLMIATLLIGGLITASGGLIERQTEHATYEELDVVGQTLAANLLSADRLATVGHQDAAAVDGVEAADVDVELRTALPDRVAGTSYTIEVNVSDDGQGELVLRAHSPDVTATVPFVVSNMDGYTESVRGGTVEIYTDEGEIRVRQA